MQVKIAAKSFTQYQLGDSGNVGQLRERPGAGNSLDHLVGAREHAIRHGKSEHLRGREVDHKLELGGLHHRKLGGLLALENPSDIPAWR